MDVKIRCGWKGRAKPWIAVLKKRDTYREVFDGFARYEELKKVKMNPYQEKAREHNGK